MTGGWQAFLDNALLFIVLINPASKVALLVALREEHRPEELSRAAWQASAVGLLLLMIFAWMGGWVLRCFFHVELYAMEIAAGAVLFLVGLGALKEGVFFGVRPGDRLSDIALVPLASPLIAGPATISAAITQAQHFGGWLVSAAIAVAVSVNVLVMLAGVRTAGRLSRSHVLGPLVRILGLLIAAIGVQMVLTGVQGWLASLGG